MITLNKNIFPLLTLILSISFFSYFITFFPSALAKEELGNEVEYFDCGQYIVRGKLGVNHQGIDFLTLYPDTTKKYPLRISDLPPSSTQSWQNLTLSLQVKIQAQGLGTNVVGKFEKMLGVEIQENLLKKAVEKV